MQDSNTGNMTHDIYDMLSYISHIATMQRAISMQWGARRG